MPTSTDAYPGNGSGPVTYLITMVGVETSFACAEHSTVLRALAAVHQGSIVAGCHGGGCGVCRIQVLHGYYESSAMSRAHVTTADEADGVTLACRTWPRSDLVVEAIGKRPSPPSTPPTNKGAFEWES